MGNFVLKLKQKHLGVTPEWNFGRTYFNKPSDPNYFNFPDDTNIGVIKIKEIPTLRHSSTYDAEKVNFLINWGRQITS